MAQATFHHGENVIEGNWGPGPEHDIEVPQAPLLPDSGPAYDLPMVKDEKLTSVAPLPIAISGLLPVLQCLPFDLPNMEGGKRSCRSGRR